MPPAPLPLIVHLLLWPFWRLSGWRYHTRSIDPRQWCWLDRGWDEIPEYVVLGGLLIYLVGLLGLLIVALSVLGQMVGWWA